MRIDLHTHSLASDGTETPGDLVRAAAAARLDVLAITDHDTAGGWAEAARVAAEAGVELVRGMEISTRYDGRPVHLLAYLPDPAYPPLAEALDAVLHGRSARVPVMVERLQDIGIDISEDDVRKVSRDTAASGRPHVADALVELGVVRDRDEAFARYLSSGRPAYAARYAVPLEVMIRVVGEAGGVSVIAHPWGRSGERPDEEALGQLAELGLAGLEVDHQDHDDRARQRLRGIAEDLSLLVTGSSDYHGTGKVDHELGCNTTSPEQYERLLALAAESSARSDRTTPDVVTG